MMNAGRFKQIRISLGLTQSQLARDAGYTERMISNYETGKNPIPTLLSRYMKFMESIDVCDECFSVYIRSSGCQECNNRA